MASVDTVSKAFLLQRQDCQAAHDLMGGTKAMRLAATRYVPRGADESADVYRDRMGRTVLLNAFRRTLNFLRGQVFQKPVQLGDDADERFQQWSEDVDRQGRNITVWSGNAFRRGLQDGVTFCLVDFASIQTRVVDGVTEYLRGDGQWARKTAAADIEEGWAPYLVHIPAEQVIDAWGDSSGGNLTVTHFRFIEDVTVQDDEWSRKTIQQIKVFSKEDGGIIRWSVWRNDEDKLSGFHLFDEGTLSIPEIPVAVFMPGDRMTDFTASPALADLADLNVRHWQVSSGHADMMEFIQRPVWFGSGLPAHTDDGEPIVFSAGRLLCSSDTDAKLESKGVDANSYEASAAELQTIKNDMAMYGLQLLQPKSGQITATEAERDGAESNSTLLNWALDFQDFLENVTRLVALWWGMEDGCSVVVNTGFTKSVDLSYLLDMYRAGVLSADTLLEMVKGAGMLPDDLDVRDESASIARNLMATGGGATTASFEEILNGGGKNGGK